MVTALSDGVGVLNALTSGGAIGPSFLLVALWELFWPEHEHALPFVRRWTNNFSLFVMSVACTALLTPGLAFVTNIALERSPLRWEPAEFGFWLHLTYACLALDALNYLLHRAMHKIPILWRLHSLHHSDVSLDVSTTVRHHPLEAIVTAVLIGVVGALFGCSTSEVAVYAVLEVVVQLIGHADVRLPSFLEVIVGGTFVTPKFHRIHHSSEVIETDSNYGQVFAFWDALFGTRGGLADETRGAIEFGLKKFRDRRSQRLDQLLLLPAHIYRSD
jgi:sterol desaturase/sphingolipid hydroxylase (fatty acid hydroxylase superfamily)